VTPGHPDGIFRITLITGDHVTAVRGAKGIESYTVDPGEGRENITFLTQSSGEGRVSVIPSDAARLLNGQKLDPALFDLGELIDSGYADDARTDLGLLTEYRETDASRVRGTLEGQARFTRPLPKLGFSGITTAKKDAGRLWKTLTGGEKGADRLQAGVTKLWLDRQAHITLDQSVAQIGAPTAWQAGYTGQDITVAVLDTGYDTDHPDLSGKIGQTADFTGTGSVEDDNGHGTHVASTIAGSGAASDGKYKGVAPGAKLAVGKVCVNTGGCPFSAILAGMQWAALDVHAKIVSMSLGSIDLPGIDPLEEAVSTLSAQTGTLFVIAAGNDYCRFGGRTVSSPGTADEALSVAAVYRDDSVADFSSCGPRLVDYGLKPEIAAPGVGIVAAAPGGGYQSMSGTSMATPHVAGAAAILAQRHPDWNGQELKGALMNSAAAVGRDVPDYHVGMGRVDVARAVTQAVTPSVGSLNVSQPWPRPADGSVTRTVTYRNTGDAPVTLALDTTITPQNGGAYDGLITLSADSLEVPSNGSAGVTLTYHGDGSGAFLGKLTATGTDGTVLARTGLSVYNETPNNVAVNFLDRAGEPADGYLMVMDRADGQLKSGEIDGQTYRLQLPAGSYYLLTEIFLEDGPALGVVPIEVDGSPNLRTVTVDGRLSKKSEITVDEPGTQKDAHALSLQVSAGGREMSVGGVIAPVYPFYVLPLEDRNVTYVARSVFTKADSGTASPTPYVYRVTDRRTGIPQNPVYHAKKDELTKVSTVYKAQGAVSEQGLISTSMITSDLPSLDLSTPVAIPSVVTEYRSPGIYQSYLESAGGVRDAPEHEIGKGKSNSEVWNAAVVGAGFENYEDKYQTGSRRGDFMSFPDLPWFLDSGPRSFSYDGFIDGTLTLSKDGQEISQWPAGAWGYAYDLPADPAVYTVRGSATRDVGSATLSPRVEAEWRFTSDGSSPDLQDNPLMTVRFSAPDLDMRNQASPGGRTELLIDTTGNPSGAVTLNMLEASFDEGVTWQKLSVQPKGSGWRAWVTDKKAGSVSLRATATDAAGNSVQQTVIRAYELTSGHHGGHH
jgi:subtilisin family serine protease